MTTMKPEYWLVFFLVLMVALVAGMSFVRQPVYVAGVEWAQEVLKYMVVSVVSFLFGRMMPEQIGDPKPGQTTNKRVQTESATTSLEPDVTVPSVEPPSPPPPVTNVQLGVAN